MRFSALIVVCSSAMSASVWTGDLYAAIEDGGQTGDSQTSLVYDLGSGELFVDPPAGKNLTSINITSAGSLFIGDKPAALDGVFDNFAPDNIFKATFGSSFGALSFGNVLPRGILRIIPSDLSVVGSLEGGGGLGAVDCVCMPEPSAIALMLFGLLAVLARRQRPRL